MSKFTDHLWQDLVREHGPTLARAERPGPRQSPGASLLRRPRILASSTLGLAGIATAVLLALGGSTAAPAFAVTKAADGSVLVKLDWAKNQNLAQVNAKLTAMGTHEQITIYMASGPATVPGAVTCVAKDGASGPTIRVLDGTNGTEVIKAGESGGNTAEGTFHLDHCTTAPASDTGPGTGNTGNPGAS